MASQRERCFAFSAFYFGVAFFQFFCGCGPFCVRIYLNQLIFFYAEEEIQAKHNIRPERINERSAMLLASKILMDIASTPSAVLDSL